MKLYDIWQGGRYTCGTVPALRQAMRAAGRETPLCYKCEANLDAEAHGAFHDQGDPLEGWTPSDNAPCHPEPPGLHDRPGLAGCYFRSVEDDNDGVHRLPSTPKTAVRRNAARAYESHEVAISASQTPIYGVQIGAWVETLGRLLRPRLGVVSEASS